MSQYDELDREIDEEMGWAVKMKKGEAKPDMIHPGTIVLHLLKKIRVPRPIWNAITTVTRAVARVVFFPIISPLGYSKSFNIDGDMMVVKRAWYWRLADAFLTRLILTPVVIGIFLIAVVYASTHPLRIHAVSTPESHGVFYKRVRLVTVDGSGLSAWYIPPMTAESLSFDPEAALTQKWPGVVVCHGLGESHDQYLPLANELHRAGFAVVMIDCRGQGESDASAVTYGLRERLDVLAGVKYLRDLPNIDASKVCVVGHDIAATAALQAAGLDSSIAAVVADGLWPSFEQRAVSIFSHPGGKELPTSWLAPLYTMAFEVAVRDRLSQLDLGNSVRNIHRQPVFFVARQGNTYARVQDIMALATGVNAHHEVLVAPEDSAPDARPNAVNERIRDFLIGATGWKGPHAKGIETLEKLLQNRVK